jgi:hypothetical protein
VPIVKLATVLAVAAAALVLWSQVQSYLDFDESGDTTISDALDSTLERTSQGGSEFDPPSITSPIGLPMAIVTVTGRPFPFEARTFQALMSSFEGLVVLGLLVTRRRSVGRAIWNRDHPYSTMAFVYWIVFCAAFASIANFGILARQRTQVFPFVAVIVAGAAVATAARRGRSDRWAVVDLTPAPVDGPDRVHA